MMTLSGITKSYGSLVALDDVSVALSPGQTTVLIGPSGCGKSTLVRVIIGLIQPDSGEVDFEGTVVTEETSQAIRRRVGYVIQDGGLFSHLTA